MEYNEKLKNETKKEKIIKKKINNTIIEEKRFHNKMSFNIKINQRYRYS